MKAKTINWKRIWLIALIGAIIIIFGGTLLGQHWAYQQQSLPWEYKHTIEVHYDK